MVETVEILNVIGISSICATLVGAALKYIFDKRNEVLKYRLLMIDKLHDDIRHYYAQLIIQAKWLSHYLRKINKTRGRTHEERYTKYSFFFLAKFLSSQYTLNEKIGGVILESHEAEEQIFCLWNCFDIQVNLDVREMAILRKHIKSTHDETWLNVDDFMSQIDANHKELKEIYEKFATTLSNRETVKHLVDLLDAFSGIFLYNINLIYKSWYKSKPKQPMDALQIFKKCRDTLAKQ